MTTEETQRLENAAQTKFRQLQDAVTTAQTKLDKSTTDSDRAQAQTELNKATTKLSTYTRSSRMDSEIPLTDNQVDEANRAAYHTVLSTLHPDIRIVYATLAGGPTNPRALWTAITRAFESTSRVGPVTLRDQLRTLKLKPGETVSELWSRINALNQELYLTGHNHNEASIQELLVNALPVSTKPSY